MSKQKTAFVSQMAVPIEMQVPYSAGRGIPGIEIPVNSCDCHHHIYDPVNFLYVPHDVRNQPPATVDAYRMLQKRLGLSRNVIIQPSAYGFDNSCTLQALKIMGSNARAVVVIDQGITPKELQFMDELGVRGIRFNFASGGCSLSNAETIKSLSQRVYELGWNVQFWMSAQETVQMESVLRAIPNQIVFDHRGHLTQPEGTSGPAYKVIAGLMEKGKAWVKLSGLYIDTMVSEPTYADTVSVGKAFVDLAPERVVWGTDWPHPSVFSKRQPWPDDALMLGLLAKQAPDEHVRKRILVQNPEVLYGF
jgi:D-galactarolactone isomerase